MASDIEDRLEQVMARVGAACARAGRAPSSVQLVAVSKTHTPDEVAELASCGVRVFGENKVQEARAKIPLCPGHLGWHLIGHLQSNKAALAAELFELIHSVDSVKLLQALDRAGDELGRNVRVLLEVNVSGEGTKFGLPPEAVKEAVEAASGLQRIEVCGLMTMAPFAPEAEKARPHFRRLRLLRDEVEQQLGARLPELSMGMSNDFEPAVEEGATLVRIGTLLFGERGKGMITS